MKDLRDISSLHEWKDNPRSINKKDFERLKGQITKLGQHTPILITKDGEVIGGNMRLKAYRELGIKNIWVSEIEPKDENNKLEYALSSNDRAGYYDDDMLANLIPNYQIDWSQYAVDMKPPEDIQQLIDRIAPVEEDEAPEVAEGEPDSKLGQLYELGRHRLMCGDSTNIEFVKTLMNGQKADMVFTDPPYGVDYDGGHATEKRREKLMGDTTTNLYEPCCEMAFKFSESNAPLYLWHAGVKGISAAAAAAAAGYEIRAEIIWNKNQAQFGAISAQYKQKHEPCFYCFKQGGSARWVGPTNEVTVWDIDRARVNDLHPTQKPVALAVRAINNHDCVKVLDLFGGSGSTLIACEQTNRICYMMEIDPRYVDVIRKRYAKFIGKEEEWIQITPKI